MGKILFKQFIEALYDSVFLQQLGFRLEWFLLVVDIIIQLVWSVMLGGVINKNCETYRFHFDLRTVERFS